MTLRAPLPVTLALLAADCAGPRPAGPPLPPPEPAAVAARTVSWDALPSEGYDVARFLPYAARAASAAGPPAEDDLLARLQDLVALPVVDPASGKEARLGDLLFALEAVRDDPPAFEARLAADRAGRTPFAAEALDQLARDGRLYSERWNPDVDADDDGILMGPTLDRDALGPPWSTWRGSSAIHQAAVLVRADLASIEAAEHDFARYPEHVGARYERIGAVPGSLVRGTDAAGNAFAALRFALKADLPFPFGGYECTLQLLHHVDARGRLVNEVWSTSPDFLWLQSQDVFVPVDTADGRRVGYLLVRRHGFDLAGVPDGNRDRRGAVRQALGNLARNAVAQARARGVVLPFAPDDVNAAIRGFAVTGWERAPAEGAPSRAGGSPSAGAP